MQKVGFGQNQTSKNKKVVVGWCSAQRIKIIMIAGGNHTLIDMTPPYTPCYNSSIN